MEIKKLSIKDKNQLEALISVVEENIENRDFWLPINNISKEHFFDESWTEFIGMFEGDALIAAVALFFNEHEYGESLRELGVKGKKVAEIGRAMVHPDYRGHNILYQLNLCLLKEAKEKNIDMLLATIHPQNLPSQKSFQKLGMKKQHTYVKGNAYLRDIYTLDIK